MKYKIIIIAILSFTQITLLDSQVIAVKNFPFVNIDYTAYPFVKNTDTKTSDYSPAKLELIQDTVTDYYDRSSGFTMYLYRDQNQVLRPITGTNGFYHLLGVKYNIQAANLLGVLIAFGTKITTGEHDSLDLLVTDADEDSGFPINPILANMGFSVNDIDTNSSVPLFTPIILPEPAALDGKFTIMLKVWTQTLESDTVVVFSNLQGDAKGENTAFFGVLQEGIAAVNFDGFPEPMGDGNPPNFDLMILPIIERDVVKTEEYFSINGENNSLIYPNPVVDKAHMKLFLDEESVVKITIIDTKGKIVNSFNYNSTHTGENILDMDISNLNNGNYFYIVNTANSTFAGKLIIKK